MFEVLFYEDARGYSEINEFLSYLGDKAVTDKNCNVQLNQIKYYVDLLKQFGTRLSKKITKHIEDDIWELRPGYNRVLYFFFKDNKFILLHVFRKKTQKTPRSEIEKAKREMNDYILRHGGKQYDHMG